MRDKIFNILNFLIEELLNSGDEVVDQEDLINDLVDMGYDLKDIDEAFKLIFEKPEIIDGVNIESVSDHNKFLNRIFTLQEKLFLPKEHRGFIKRLLYMNIITIKETETVINKILQNVYYNKKKNVDFWKLLEEVIDDQKRIEYISNKFSEFTANISNDFKYIN